MSTPKRQRTLKVTATGSRVVDRHQHARTALSRQRQRQRQCRSRSAIGFDGDSNHSNLVLQCSADSTAVGAGNKRGRNPASGNHARQNSASCLHRRWHGYTTIWSPGTNRSATAASVAEPELNAHGVFRTFARCDRKLEAFTSRIGRSRVLVCGRKQNASRLMCEMLLKLLEMKEQSVDNRVESSRRALTRNRRNHCSTDNIWL
jgi:hypothetical protein